MQLLESPIPPLTAAALQIIICKRPALILNHEKGIFVTPHNEVKCVLSETNIRGGALWARRPDN